MALTCLLWYTGPMAAQGPSEQAPLILHMLDYVAVDYPEFVQDGIVLDAAEYAEQVEFSQQVQSMLVQLPAHPDQPGLLHQATQLVALIQAKRPGSEVAALATQLRWSRDGRVGGLVVTGTLSMPNPTFPAWMIVSNV